jgi:cyclin A
MRATLIDWLVEMIQWNNLNAEILFLAVDIMDRFLSKRDLNKRNLQLLGVVSLWIAAKLEDGRIDHNHLITELLHMTEDSYTLDQVTELIIDFCNHLEGQEA